jgi:hypothetical protein
VTRTAGRLGIPWILVAGLLAACEPGPTPPGADGGIGPGFDDHTVPSITTRADFERLAAGDTPRPALKFLLADFRQPEARTIRYLDAAFFTLHDEWYWFRLLNGQPAPGAATTPVPGLSFATIADVYAWATPRTTLPLDLRFTSDRRLYSNRFYELALSEPKTYGLGTVIRIPATADRPERFVFELEYSEALSHADLLIYFDALEASLPAELGREILWVVRSPAQEALAQVMKAEGLRHHDRIVRYADLVVPGETEVYAAGITAGRLRILRSGDDLGDTTAQEVLVLEHVPDWLPPAAGLITAAPQTPLAHVNVLARNRGIPNAFRGGVLDDPALDQLGRVRAPVAVRATPPDRLEIVALTEAEYRQYLDRKRPSVAAVPWIDTSTLPYAVDLAAHGLESMERLRPIVGGKAAGYLGLMAPGDVPIPDTPLALSIRAYAEHIRPLEARLAAMLDDLEFRQSARSRFLVLEGPEDFAKRYSSADDARFLAVYADQHPPGQVLGDFVRAGGVKAELRAMPIAPATLAELEATLRRHFAALAPSQGLRFRSSSTVEDIEGFNGAGLYDSNTGFFEPTLQADPKEHKRTIEWAIKKTWASYWGAEAFEERQAERIEHLTGHMAVLVHPRFDDDKERANGVLTFTLLPPGDPREAVMELDLQAGAESVANPSGGPEVRPEIDMLSLDRGATTPSIERVRGSSLVPAGTWLFDDARLLEVFAHAKAITERWLAEANRGVDEARRGRTLTLDMELKDLAEGWPALASGEQRPAHWLLKQARSLEPGLRGLLPAHRALPFPRDVLARVRRIERWSCRSGGLELELLQATTDPLRLPDVGFSELPLLGAVIAEASAGLPALGWPEGTRIEATHPSHRAVTRSTTAFGLSLDFDPAASTGLERLEIEGSRLLLRVAGGAELRAADLSCLPTVLHSTPEDYLAALLDAGR